MAGDRDSNVWIGTGEGLLRVNARGVSQLEPGEEERSLAVTALFEDREGSLWIGTPRGLERLRDTQLHHLRTRGGTALGERRADPRRSRRAHVVRAA